MCGNNYDQTPEGSRLTKLACDGLSAEITRLVWAGIPSECLRAALGEVTGNFIAVQDGPEAVGSWFHGEGQFHAAKAAAETNPSDEEEKQADAYIARARACTDMTDLRALAREAELTLAGMRPEIAAGVDTEFAKARKRFFPAIETTDDEWPF